MKHSRNSLLALVLTLPLLLLACAADDPGSPEAPTCEDGQCDGSFGWIEEGERCFNFNSECVDGLVCIPTDKFEDGQFCQPPGTEGFLCDDHDDCVSGHICKGESSINAGRCSEELTPCTFNWSCDDGLVCRPIRSADGDRLCMTQGGFGNFCNDDDDCVDGLLCHNASTVISGTCRN